MEGIVMSPVSLLWGFWSQDNSSQSLRNPALRAQGGSFTRKTIISSYARITLIFEVWPLLEYTPN